MCDSFIASGSQALRLFLHSLPKQYQSLGIERLRVHPAQTLSSYPGALRTSQRAPLPAALHHLLQSLPFSHPRDMGKGAQLCGHASLKALRAFRL